MIFTNFTLLQYSKCNFILVKKKFFEIKIFRKKSFKIEKYLSQMRGLETINKNKIFEYSVNRIIIIKRTLHKVNFDQKIRQIYD